MSVSARVLVVEDDTDIREGIIDALNDYGYPAEGAPNGLRALEHLRKDSEPPCLIILDLMMPVMDGKQFREEQLRDPKLSSIPVVVVSAYRDIEARAKELGARALQKPLQLDELMRVVAESCTSKGQRPS